MSENTIRSLIRSGVVGGGVGLLLGLAVILFAAPTMDVNQVADWDDPWSASEDVQLAEFEPVEIEVVSTETYDIVAGFQPVVR